MFNNISIISYLDGGDCSTHRKPPTTRPVACYSLLEIKSILSCEVYIKNSSMNMKCCSEAELNTYR